MYYIDKTWRNRIPMHYHAQGKSDTFADFLVSYVNHYISQCKVEWIDSMAALRSASVTQFEKVSLALRTFSAFNLYSQNSKETSPTTTMLPSSNVGLFSKEQVITILRRIFTTSYREEHNMRHSNNTAHIVYYYDRIVTTKNTEQDSIEAIVETVLEKHSKCSLALMTKSTRTLEFDECLPIISSTLEYIEMGIQTAECVLSPPRVMLPQIRRDLFSLTLASSATGAAAFFASLYFIKLLKSRMSPAVRKLSCISHIFLPASAGALIVGNLLKNRVRIRPDSKKIFCISGAGSTVGLLLALAARNWLMKKTTHKLPFYVIWGACVAIGSAIAGRFSSSRIPLTSHTL